VTPNVQRTWKTIQMSCQGSEVEHDLGRARRHGVPVAGGGGGARATAGLGRTGRRRGGAAAGCRVAGGEGRSRAGPRRAGCHPSDYWVIGCGLQFWVRSTPRIASSAHPIHPNAPKSTVPLCARRDQTRLAPRRELAWDQRSGQPDPTSASSSSSKVGASGRSAMSATLPMSWSWLRAEASIADSRSTSISAKI